MKCSLNEEEIIGNKSIDLQIGKRLIEKKQSASFLAISATFVNHGSGYVVPSASAKSGVETFYQSLASEWSKYGMRFNVIAPGMYRIFGMNLFYKLADSIVPLVFRLSTFV